MKILEFKNSMSNQKTSIVVNKITGITEIEENQKSCYGKTFIATGADGEFSENGFYVSESYEDVKAALIEAL